MLLNMPPFCRRKVCGCHFTWCMPSQNASTSQKQPPSFFGSVTSLMNPTNIPSLLNYLKSNTTASRLGCEFTTFTPQATPLSLSMNYSCRCRFGELQHVPPLYHPLAKKPPNCLAIRPLSKPQMVRLAVAPLLAGEPPHRRAGMPVHRWLRDHVRLRYQLRTRRRGERGELGELLEW